MNIARFIVLVKKAPAKLGVKIILLLFDIFSHCSQKSSWIPKLSRQKVEKSIVLEIQLQ